MVTNLDRLNEGIEHHKRALATLKSLVTRYATGSDDNLAQELSRYLVVRSCGYVEWVAKEYSRSHILQNADVHTGAFAQSWLKNGRNPNPDNLLDLMGRFSPDWKDELNQLLNQDDKLLRRELKKLVDSRNAIAHGESDDVTMRRAIQLSDTALRVAKWFEERPVT